MNINAWSTYSVTPLWSNLGAQGGSEVHAVQQHIKPSKPKAPGSFTPTGRPVPVSPTNGPKPGQKKPPSPCWRCGAWHYVKFCPFKQHQCRRCQKVGHKDAFCQSTPPAPTQAQRRLPKKPVAASRSLVVAFESGRHLFRRKLLTILINGQPVRMQLDTASDITILSNEVWRTLGQPPVKPSSQTAISACGGHLPLHGQLVCCVSFRGVTFNGTCYISDSNLNLLGLDWFEQPWSGRITCQCHMQSHRSSFGSSPTSRRYRQTISRCCFNQALDFVPKPKLSSNSCQMLRQFFVPNVQFHMHPCPW